MLRKVVTTNFIHTFRFHLHDTQADRHGTWLTYFKTSFGYDRFFFVFFFFEQVKPLTKVIKLMTTTKQPETEEANKQQTNKHISFLP
jgi:hypothetical protein